MTTNATVASGTNSCITRQQAAEWNAGSSNACHEGSRRRLKAAGCFALPFDPVAGTISMCFVHRRNHGPKMMETVAFISTENGDDLIVSFAVIDPVDPTEIESLTLLRTPKYEHVLGDCERGVSVSFERYVEDAQELLEDSTLTENQP
jgi:hypothetical protein